MATFGATCSGNVEYSEFSNEVLFHVLLKQPLFVVQFVEADLVPERTSYVLAQLSRPISDGIRREDHIRVVSRVEGHVRSRDRILEALKQAH